MSSYHLAIDLGASSGRAMLGRLSCDRLEMQEVHRFETPVVASGGHFFWDLEALWNEVASGLEAAVRVAPSLRSVSVDSWAVDYVPLDAAGQPLRNPYCYRDPRTSGRLTQALDRITPEKLYDRTGIQMLEINTLYQLLADLDDEPELVEQTATRLLVADYLLYRLGGRAVVERTMASTTQLMNVRTGQWDRDLMRWLNIPAHGWPEIVAPGTPIGRLAAHSGIEVVAGCSHDTACAVAAVPADAAGTSWAFLSSGTWSLMGVEQPEPVLGEAARAANFTNEAGVDGTIRFLKNLTGLWVLQECERSWRADGDVFDYEQLMAEAEAAPSPGRYVDLDDPRFARPGDMPTRLCDYCRERGWPVPAGRGAFVRLILESLAEGYRQTLDQLEGLTGRCVDVLHVVGGGARNALLCQWTADACGCRVVAGPAEATAMGNLLVQARALGDLPAGRTIRDVARRSAALRTFVPSKHEAAT